MTVRKAVPGDIGRIMEIYSSAREYMIRSGNPNQWGHSYPPIELIESDIENGRCRVVEENGRIHGVFALFSEPDPTYAVIYGGKWLNDLPYLTIHRVAGDGETKGIFRAVADHCAALSDNLRADTHHDNLTMQRCLERCGFIRCGTIRLADGSPRIAYQRFTGGENR